jgi:hypothetical protein
MVPGKMNNSSYKTTIKNVILDAQLHEFQGILFALTPSRQEIPFFYDTQGSSLCS